MKAVEGLEATYRLMQPHLDALDTLLDEQFHADAPTVDAMLTYASRYSGKRLRPALVFMIAGIGGEVTDRHVRLGAVVEMIHMATLVHDDVLDRATTRRNAPSINQRWQNKDAILLGDIIFARAINLLVSIGDRHALDLLTRTVSVICEGEIMQNQLSHDPEVDEAVYTDIIDRKTASLYSAGCELAAHLSGASKPLVDAFSDFGAKLGRAFQIIDDCLDISGDESVVGKSLGTDVLNGKATLPMIRLLDRVDDATRGELEGIIRSHDRGTPDIARVRELMVAHDTLGDALRHADELVHSALVPLRELLPKADFEIVEALASFVLHRRR